MRVLEQLLHLEGKKHRALLSCDSAGYEDHVTAQLRVMQDCSDFAAEAKSSPGELELLSRLVRLNTVLLLNHFIASPVSPLNVLAGAAYDSSGSAASRPSATFSLQG
jgi:hypothetical protein